MESEYSKDKVSMEMLREVCRSRGMTLRDASERMGRNPGYLALLSSGQQIPSTGVLAEICAVLRCSVRDVLVFRDVKVKNRYMEPSPYTMPENPVGEPTYEPLRRLIISFYMWKEGPEKKDINDFFNGLPRTHIWTEDRLVNGRTAVRKALDARGFTESELGSPKRKNPYAEGLPLRTRAAIMHDRPVKLWTIYDMCKVLGCTPDWVMSYK